MIRSAEKAKTPIMCVVGDKERDAGRLLLPVLQLASVLIAIISTLHLPIVVLPACFT